MDVKYVKTNSLLGAREATHQGGSGTGGTKRHPNEGDLICGTFTFEMRGSRDFPSLMEGFGLQGPPSGIF